MNPVPFSWMLIAIGVAFGSGNFTGWYGTHKFYQVEELSRKLASFQLNEKRVRVVLGLNETLDEGAENEERQNIEVLEGIEKLRLSRPLADDRNTVCVDDGIMQSIGLLK